MLRRLRHGERHRYLFTLPAVGTPHCIQPDLSVRRSIGTAYTVARGIAPISADRSGPHAIPRCCAPCGPRHRAAPLQPCIGSAG